MNIEVGSPAPDFSLPDQENNKITLSALRGKNVILIFYPLDFSPTCTRELHDVTRLRERFANAEVYGISVDSRWCHGAFKREEGLAIPLLADFNPKGEVARLYDAWLDGPGFATRATFVIDREGIIRHVQKTDSSTARDQEEAIAALALCPV